MVHSRKLDIQSCTWYKPYWQSPAWQRTHSNAHVRDAPYPWSGLNAAIRRRALRVLCPLHSVQAVAKSRCKGRKDAKSARSARGCKVQKRSPCRSGRSSTRAQISSTSQAFPHCHCSGSCTSRRWHHGQPRTKCGCVATGRGPREQATRQRSPAWLCRETHGQMSCRSSGCRNAAVHHAYWAHPTSDEARAGRDGLLR